MYKCIYYRPVPLIRAKLVVSHTYSEMVRAYRYIIYGGGGANGKRRRRWRLPVKHTETSIVSYNIYVPHKCAWSGFDSTVAFVVYFRLLKTVNGPIGLFSLFRINLDYPNDTSDWPCLMCTTYYYKITAAFVPCFWPFKTARKTVHSKFFHRSRDIPVEEILKICILDKVIRPYLNNIACRCTRKSIFFS